MTALRQGVILRDGWHLVENDPVSSRHPEEIVAIRDDKKRVLVRMNIRSGEVHAHTIDQGVAAPEPSFALMYVQGSDTPWRARGVRFVDIGEIGHAAATTLESLR